MISVHFNQETITDLIDILHGQQFRRSYFLEKSTDYLIRLAYISNQFGISALKLMMDDCIFNKAKQDQISDGDNNSLIVAIEYALKTKNSPLFECLLGLVRVFDFKKHSPMYKEIRSTIRDCGGLMLMTMLDAW